MLDVGWSELLVIGIVALVVVGPKELPALLRTIGRYVGIVKRQAAEFRSQFDEAIRESELDQLRKDVEQLKSDTESTLRDAERSFSSEINSAQREIEAAASDPAAAVEALPGPSGEQAAVSDSTSQAESGSAPASSATDESAPRRGASAP